MRETFCGEGWSGRHESGFRLVQDTSDEGISEFISWALAHLAPPFDRVHIATSDVVLYVYDNGGTVSAATVNYILGSNDAVESIGRMPLFYRSDNLWRVKELPVGGDASGVRSAYEEQEIAAGRHTDRVWREVLSDMERDLPGWFAAGVKFTAMDAVLRAWQDYGAIFGTRDMKSCIERTGGRLLGQRRKVAEAPNEFMYGADEGVES